MGDWLDLQINWTFSGDDIRLKHGDIIGPLTLPKSVNLAELNKRIDAISLSTKNGHGKFTATLHELVDEKIYLRFTFEPDPEIVDEVNMVTNSDDFRKLHALSIMYKWIESYLPTIVDEYISKFRPEYLLCVTTLKSKLSAVSISFITSKMTYVELVDYLDGGVDSIFGNIANMFNRKEVGCLCDEVIRAYCDLILGVINELFSE